MLFVRMPSTYTRSQEKLYLHQQPLATPRATADILDQTGSPAGDEPISRSPVTWYSLQLMLAKRRTRESGLSVGASLAAACLVNDAMRVASMA